MLGNPTRRENPDRLAGGVRTGSGVSMLLASMCALALGPSVILLMSFGIFLPALRHEFGWSVASISFGASIISVVVMLVSPLQGCLADKVGARALVLVSLPAFGFGLMLMYFLPASLAAFYLACALLPVLGLGLWPLSYMKAVTTWFDRNLGLALGIANVGLGIGSTLLPFVLGAVFLHFGWRAAYAMLGAAVIVLVWPVAAVWLRESGADPIARRSGSLAAPAGLGFREAAATPDFAIMAVNFALLGAVSTGMLAHQVNILTEAGVGAGNAVYIQSAVGAGILLIAGLGCGVLATPLAAKFGVLAASSIGFVIGAEFDLLGVLVRRQQGMPAFGRIYESVFSAFQLGGALGAAGLAFSRSTLHSYEPALLTLCALSFAGDGLFGLLGPCRFGASAPAGGLPQAQPALAAE